jgi:hypothetical protein
MISPPLDGDNRNWYGAQMHNIWFLQTLGKALTDAREGRLTVDWRDRLTTPYDNPEARGRSRSRGSARNAPRRMGTRACPGLAPGAVCIKKLSSTRGPRLR